MCSTPFGITEYIGGPELDRWAREVVECSTPFGITEYIGALDRLHHRLQHRVLNAFRHHGVYRAGRTGSGRRRIRVLNAFRHHGVYRSEGVRLSINRSTEMCSTPFGITEYIGRQRSVIVEAPEKCSTPFGITEYIGDVLFARARLDELCSTPFGITEYIGPASQVVLVQERRREFAWTLPQL